MPDLGEVFATLETLDHATLARVRAELDRILTAKIAGNGKTVETSVAEIRLRGRW